GIGVQVRPFRPPRQQPRSLGGVEDALTLADQIDAALQAVAVDEDLDAVAVAHLADRPARQRLGSDVADARSGRDAGETGVGQHGHILAETEVLQSGSDLINFLHSGSHWSATDKHKDVAGLNAVGSVSLDGGDGGLLAGEDARLPDLAIHAVVVHNARI